MLFPNHDGEHFRVVGVASGIAHKWGGLIVSPNISTKAQGKLHSIISRFGSLYYIGNRVSDLVAGLLLVQHLGPSFHGRLGTIEENLYHGVNYVISEGDESMTIGFTQGKEGFEKRKVLSSGHTIIQINGSMLHGYVRDIANQLQSIPEDSSALNVIITRVYRRNKTAIDEKFFGETKGVI